MGYFETGFKFSFYHLSVQLHYTLRVKTFSDNNS